MKCDSPYSASKSGKKKKPQGRSAPTPTSGGGSMMGQGSDKSSKGLRHFSMKVCKKVEEKGRTNYNEVRPATGGFRSICRASRH